MRICSRLVILVTLLCPIAAVPVSAATDINRFIGEGTIVAGQADLTKIDAPALEAFLLDLARSAAIAGPEAPQTSDAEVKAGLAHVTKLIADVKQAGATEILAVADFAHVEHPPALIIPVSDDKANAVAALIPAPPQPPGARGRPDMRIPQVESVPGIGVVFGTPGQVHMVKTIKPAPRPDLAAALAAAGAAPIRIALSMNAQMRQELTQKSPPQLLGKPSTLITKDLQWVIVSATPPPAAAIKAAAQSSSPESAKATAELIVAAIQQGQRGPDRMPAEFEKLLTPAAVGDQAVVALDAKQLTALAVAMREPLARARRVALRVESSRNIRQLLISGVQHAGKNKGAWPADMKELEKAATSFGAKDVRQLLTNPARPDVQPGYVYVKPARNNPAGETVVIYESHKEFGEGINVGFADGHVEWVARKQQFDEMLARTAQAP